MDFKWVINHIVGARKVNTEEVEITYLANIPQITQPCTSGRFFSPEDLKSLNIEIDEYYDNLLEQQDISDEVKDIIKEKRGQIKKTLRILHQRLVLKELINYYKIEEQDLDNILDIFVRVNSGGTILSKSDLLFSTIVANWEQGREEIETFLE